MSFFLRAFLFSISILLVAEDFQYLLKIDSFALEQTENLEEDCEQEDSESKGEKEEETKKQDENKDSDSETLSHICSRLTKNIFRDALYYLSDIAHELESPPPEQA